MKHEPIKLLHILPAYYKSDGLTYEAIASWGGGERYAAALALATSKITPTRLVTFGTENRTFREKSLEIVVLKSRPLLKKINGHTEFFSIPLMRMIREFDVIHAHQHFTDTTIQAGIMGRLYGKKVFSSDLGFTGANLARFVPADKLIARLLCLTEYDLKRFQLPPNKTGVIYGGVDLSKYAFHAKKKPKALFVGRLLPHKGVNYLIDAVDDSFSCVVAGHPYDQPYFTYLQERARGKNVEFLQSPSDQEVVKQLQEATVLVLPSVDIDYVGKTHKNPELFGLVVAEAFACGTPAIVSDSSALPYVVRDGVDGFVVEQNNAKAISEKIHYLLTNPEAAREFGANARQKAESIFNWDKVAELALSYYSEGTSA
jgi:alpha-maltose-1-phosphate synthase